MVKSVAHVVALDAQTRAEVLEQGVRCECVDIIQNGLVFQRPPVRMGRVFSGQPLTILYLGRLAQQKGLDNLLSAFASIKDRSDVIHTLRIVGGGAQAACLSARARELGVSDRCTFPGAVSIPEDELERANCFVNPSESEGLPNAVLEAAAFGLPLILSDIPVHRQIATEVGMADYLFPVGDAIALAGSLARFSDLSVEHQNRLSRQCAAFGQRYTPEKRDHAYLALYRSVLGRNNNQC
jgi:glycosyltransferase involved in cell wall biosynthesis